MKIDFNSRGDLVVKPENFVERLALTAWIKDRGTFTQPRKILVDLTPQPMPPFPPDNPDHVIEV